MKYALIKDSVVVNLILIDDSSAYSIPVNCEIVHIDDTYPVDIGFTYTNGIFTPPQEPQP